MRSVGIDARPSRDTRSLGQSLPELALVLPVLIIVILGAIDFGRLLGARVNAEAALRAGASWGATNLHTARQPLLPVGTGTCGTSTYSPSCNILARACLESRPFPGFAGGRVYTGSGGATYQVCAGGSAANVCVSGGAQTNPFLIIRWSHANGQGFVPSDTNSPVAGDRITVDGSYCFKTISNFPLLPKDVTLRTSSTYTVQQ